MEFSKRAGWGMRKRTQRRLENQKMERATMKHLGILVKSAAKIDWVYNLARAAGSRNKSVWVHFAENGVLGLQEQQIEKLMPYAKVSICRSSADRLGSATELCRQYGPCFAPPSAVADMIRDCERYLVL
jgi:hypothetical protein